MLIDAHCHLDVFVQRKILRSILGDAKENDINGFVVTGTSENDWDLYLNLAKEYSSIVCALGLHPTEVKEEWHSSLNYLEHILTVKRPVAIGEIGLDFYRSGNDSNVIERQQVVFEAQLTLAKKYNLPVVIHCREAFLPVQNMLDKAGFDWTKVLFHCFTGGPEEAEFLKHKGAYVSFSGIVTYKNAGNIRQALKIFSLENTLIETDCPYLAPVPHRGKENTPAFLKATAQFIANFLGTTYEHVAKKTMDNTKKFFKAQFEG